MHKSLLHKLGLTLISLMLVACNGSTPTPVSSGDGIGVAESSEFVYFVTTDNTPEVRMTGSVFEVTTDNCGSPVSSVETFSRSRHFDIALELELSRSVIAEVGGGVPGVAEAKLGTEVGLSLGVRIGASETAAAQRQIETPGNSRSTAKLQWEEVWSKGTISIERADGTQVGEVPFAALTTLHLTQLGIEVWPCTLTPEPTSTPASQVPTATLTPTDTSKPIEPEPPTPTNTPEDVQEPATVCNTPLVILDDFSRSSPDAAVWMTGDTASGSYEVSDGKLVFTAENTTDEWQVRALALQLRQDYRAVEATFTLRDVANGKGSIGFGGVFGDEAYDYRFLYRLWTDAAAPETESLIGWEVTEGSQIVVSKNSALHFPEFPTTHTLRVAVEQDSLTFCVDGRLEDVITVPQTSAKYGRWIQLEYHLESGASLKAIVDDVQIQYAY